MNIENCANGNCSNGWMYAAGGLVLGFVGMTLLQKRRMTSNPGGQIFEIDGNLLMVRKDGLPEGMYAVYAMRPTGKSEDLIGTIVRGTGRSFRAFPPERYDRIRVTSDLPEFILSRGTLTGSIYKAVAYLNKVYQRAYKRSASYKAAYKRRLGREFSEALGAA